MCETETTQSKKLTAPLYGAERKKSMNYFRDPEPPVDPPEPDEDDVAEMCTSCRQPIYYGEVYGEYNGKRVCLDCLENEWRSLSDSEKFARLDYHPVERSKPEGRRRR